MTKDILEVFDTIIRGEKAVTFPLVNHDGWISDQNGHHILDMRGWGFLQYADNDEGADLQDAICHWIVETLNKKHEELRSQK